MSTGPITTALRNAAAKVRQLNVTTEAEDQTLRDAADLVRVLASLMDGRAPIKAFGAPGDWGYDTEIGRAIVALREGPTDADIAGESQAAANEQHVLGLLGRCLGVLSTLEGEDTTEQEMLDALTLDVKQAVGMVPLVRGGLI